MAAPMDHSQHDNSSYIMDAESATEMARLMHQDRLITQGMGGIIPEQEPAVLAGLHTVLDVSCGPGGWVLDMAHIYPHMKITGVDISNTMVEYAHAQAWAQGLDNASFRVMDALKPLDFPDNSFDLVNGRLIFSYMPRDAWPAFIQECKRVLRPGGILRLTEWEWYLSTSKAAGDLGAMLTRALYKTGRSFSPDGRQINITPMMRRLLLNAGYQNIHHRAHAIDFSSDSEYHHGFYQNYVIGFKMIQPFIVGSGVATNDEYEQIYQQGMVEMMMDDFCAIWYYLTVWGERDS